MKFLQRDLEKLVKGATRPRQEAKGSEGQRQGAPECHGRTSRELDRWSPASRTCSVM